MPSQVRSPPSQFHAVGAVQATLTPLLASQKHPASFCRVLKLETSSSGPSSKLRPMLPRVLVADHPTPLSRPIQALSEYPLGPLGLLR